MDDVWKYMIDSVKPEYVKKLYYDDMINELAGKIKSLKRSHLLVSFIGLDRSGKSTIGRRLCERLGSDAIMLSISGYMLDREKRKYLGISPFHPSAFMKEKALEDIDKLLQKGYAEIPVYSHNEGRVVGEKRIEARDIMIIDSISAFYINEILDFIGFVHADDDVRWKRRLNVDLKERKYPSYEYIKNDFERKIEDFEKYMKARIPEISDVFVNTTHNNIVELFYKK